jgi:hypothetical protein
LAKIKNTLTSIQGLDYSQKVVYYLAKTAILYYKKDQYTEGIFSPRSLVTRNSLAAEFAQRSEAVWGWEKPDIDRFITALETAEILMKEPRDSGKTDPIINTKYFGRIATKNGKIIFAGIPYKVREDFIYSARKLRKDTGVTVEGKLAFMLTRYTPAFLFILLFLAIKNGFKELTGDKKQ